MGDVSTTFYFYVGSVCKWIFDTVLLGATGSTDSYSRLMVKRSTLKNLYSEYSTNTIYD